MKITLNTQELNQAVVEYLSNQGLTIDTSKVSITVDEEGITVDTAVTANTTQKPKKAKKEESKVAEETVTEAPVSSSIAEVEAASTSVAKPTTNALFGSNEPTDDVLEDDTPQIPKEDAVEKTRKLFA